MTKNGNILCRCQLAQRFPRVRPCCAAPCDDEGPLCILQKHGCLCDAGMRGLRTGRSKLSRGQIKSALDDGRFKTLRNTQHSHARPPRHCIKQGCVNKLWQTHSVGYHLCPLGKGLDHIEAIIGFFACGLACVGRMQRENQYHR